MDSAREVEWGTSAGTCLISVEYSIKGESAPAAGNPSRGRSALDAVELMDVGWNFRREHLRLEQRSHYVITNGGDQPNVVPPNASVWYYFRETSYEEIKKLWEIGDRMAQAAALMTDTTVTSTVLGSAWPGHFNKTIAETMNANIEKVGLPTWSEADQALAKGLQHGRKGPEVGRETTRQRRRAGAAWGPPRVGTRGRWRERDAEESSRPGSRARLRADITSPRTSA